MVSWGAVAVGRVAFAKYLLNMSVTHWLKRIILPIYAGIVISAGIGALPRLFMTQSFARLVCSSVACEISFLVVAWYWVFDVKEKEYVLEKIKRYIK